MDRFLAGVHRPSNTVELFRNIKVAIDNNLLLREDFYTEANFVLFFGSMKYGGDWLRKTRSDPRFVRLYLSGFGEMCPPWQLRPDKQIDALGISIDRDLTGPGEKWADLQVAIHTSCGPTFADVEMIFGTRWELQDQLLPDPRYMAQSPPPATGPHGNDLVRYDDSVPGQRRELLFYFYSDGHVDRAYFTINR